MHCGLCQRPAGADRPLTCELCIQMAVYQPRVALTQSLLENESLGQQVEKEIVPQKPQKTSFLSSKIPDSNPKWAHDCSTEAAFATEAKVQELSAHTKAVREEIQHMRLDVAKRKAHLNRRRKDQASARDELSKASKKGQEPLEADCKEIARYWERLQGHTRQIRVENCSKTARLFSLRQENKRMSGSKRQVYSIGFLPIPDLRELNSKMNPFPVYSKMVKLICCIRRPPSPADSHAPPPRQSCTHDLPPARPQAPSSNPPPHIHLPQTAHPLAIRLVHNRIPHPPRRPHLQHAQCAPPQPAPCPPLIP